MLDYEIYAEAYEWEQSEEVLEALWENYPPTFKKNKKNKKNS